MNKKDFERLSDEGFNHVPLVLETFADLDTPLSIYLKYANQPYSYLLESVQGGEQFGRYSFIGLPSKVRYEVRGHACSEIRDGIVVSEMEKSDPINWVSELQQRTKAFYRDDLPRFLGGLVGYFGYETIHLIEKRVGGSDPKPDSIGCPDILLLHSDEVIVYDNLASKLYFVVFANPQETGAYDIAQKRLSTLFLALRQPVEELPEERRQLERPLEETSENQFYQSVERAKEYICEGDIMQVVLSQRMSVPFHAPPLSLYRALRALNPSPYMFYFNLQDFHVVGASPEILVRLENDMVTVRPIAGTRPRGNSRDEDAAYERDLLADPKEIAEHVMLMDLGRNDLGRVAQVGSVEVTAQMAIERYSHVMHIVSNVEGKLLDGLSAIDVLRASFPAGTVSGAPKVRAMEIIDELEPSKRGVYSGAVGYLGFNGDMDVAIAIRTAVIKDEMLYVQAGAGIVADSKPENEWIETKNKAKAILRAAEIAEAGLNR